MLTKQEIRHNESLSMAVSPLAATIGAYSNSMHHFIAHDKTCKHVWEDFYNLGCIRRWHLNKVHWV
jgi:hypothetical protein